MNMNIRKWRRNWSPFFISYKSNFDKIIGYFLQTENLALQLWYDAVIKEKEGFIKGKDDRNKKADQKLQRTNCIK